MGRKRKEDSKEKPDRRSLMATYRIKWAPELTNGLPEVFKIIFESVKAYGSKTFRELNDPQYLGSSHSRKIFLHRARRITFDAIHYREVKEQAIEDSWRDLETELFQHLNYETICNDCHAPTWRLDVTGLPQGHGLGANDPIENGPSDECACSTCYLPLQRSRAIVLRKEPGFSYEAGLQKQLDKSSERPDVVFGLMKVEALKETTNALLNRPDGAPFPMAPFVKSKSSICLFPFLICEAKGGNAKTNVLEIEGQMSFSVRQALLVQRALATQNGRARRLFEPLVWCIYYHGEDWNLYAAYLSPECEGAAYDFDDKLHSLETSIVGLWSGKLTKLNAAVQFLLLIDYISTWASRRYLEDIIRAMKLFLRDEKPLVNGRFLTPALDDIAEGALILGSSCENLETGSNEYSLSKEVLSSAISQVMMKDELMDTNSLERHREKKNAPESHGGVTEDESPGKYNDINRASSETKTFSLSDSRQKRLSQDVDSSSTNYELHPSETTRTGVQEDEFSRFDTAGCTYKNASLIELRLIGLVLTPMNLGQFEAPQEYVGQRMGKLAIQLAKGDLAVMTAATLSYIESAWTGKLSKLLLSQPSDRKFYVLMQFAAYLSPEWRQVHELSYYAVTESLLSDIMLGCGAKRSYRVSNVDLPRARTLVNVFQNTSLHGNLSACAHRVLLSPILEWRPGLIGLLGYSGPDSEHRQIWLSPWEGRGAPRTYLWTLYRSDVRLADSSLYSHVLDAAARQLIPSAQELATGHPWTTSTLSPEDSLVLCKDGSAWCMFVVGEDQFSYPSLKSITIAAAHKVKRHEPRSTREIGAWNTNLQRSASAQLVQPSSLVLEKSSIFIQDLIEAWKKTKSTAKSLRNVPDSEFV